MKTKLWLLIASAAGVFLCFLMLIPMLGGSRRYGFGGGYSPPDSWPRGEPLPIDFTITGSAKSLAQFSRGLDSFCCDYRYCDSSSTGEWRRLAMTGVADSDTQWTMRTEIPTPSDPSCEGIEFYFSWRWCGNPFKRGESWIQPSGQLIPHVVMFDAGATPTIDD